MHFQEREDKSDIYKTKGRSVKTVHTPINGIEVTET